MLTLESKYSEFIDLVMGKNACTRAVDMITEVDKAREGGETLEVGLTKSIETDLKTVGSQVVNETTLWCLKTVGKELDKKVREILLNTITSPVIAMKVKTLCSYLTSEEITFLDGVYKGKIDSSTVQDPMEAARLYIDCAPVLTEAEDITLKSIFKGKLPTVEKELRDGIVTRATAEVAP
jgi:hypothetical protein